MSLKGTDVRERFCTAIQSLLAAYQLRLLGFEIYKVVAEESTVYLVELQDAGDLKPNTTFMVVVSYEKEGRCVEFHTKYHLTRNRDLVEDFFGVMSSDIYKEEDPGEVEVSSVPGTLRMSMVGVISELVRRLQDEMPGGRDLAGPT